MATSKNLIRVSINLSRKTAIIIGILVLSLTCNSAPKKKPQIKTQNFSFTLKCGEVLEDTCVLGSWRTGISLVLLPESGSETCLATTQKAFKQKKQGSKKITLVTKLLKSKKCDPEEEYFFAFIQSQFKEYTSFEMKPLSSRDLKAKILRTIKTKGTLSQIVKGSRQPLMYSAAEIESRLPQFFQVSLAQFNPVYFAKYSVSAKDKNDVIYSNENGPIILFRDEGPQSLGEVCSEPLKVFRLNGEVYFLSGPSCCTCEWKIKTIYRYNNQRAVNVYSSPDLTF